MAADSPSVSIDRAIHGACSTRAWENPDVSRSANMSATVFVARSAVSCGFVMCGFLMRLCCRSKNLSCVGSL